MHSADRNQLKEHDVCARKFRAPAKTLGKPSWSLAWFCANSGLVYWNVALRWHAWLFAINIENILSSIRVWLTYI